jgi:integrase/recombinase XerD
LDRTVSDELPGFVPEVVRGSPGVLLLRTERALDAMLSGWRSQMVERALTVNTIKARCRFVVNQFVEFTNEYPWRWRPVDVDEFLAAVCHRAFHR